MNDLTQKKKDLITKAYNELNILREKGLNLPTKEDVFFAGGEYAYMEDIACILESLLERDSLEEDDIDGLLAKEHLLEKIYEEWTFPQYDTSFDIVSSIFTIAKSEDYDWG